MDTSLHFETTDTGMVSYLFAVFCWYLCLHQSDASWPVELSCTLWSWIMVM